jgi:hypothetical protein
MDEQAVRKLFIAFLAMILGAALGGGLVMFCARPASSHPAAVSATRPADGIFIPASSPVSTPSRQLPRDVE